MTKTQKNSIHMTVFYVFYTPALVFLCVQVLELNIMATFSPAPLLQWICLLYGIYMQARVGLFSKVFPDIKMIIPYGLVAPYNVKRYMGEKLLKSCTVYSLYQRSWPLFSIPGFRDQKFNNFQTIFFTKIQIDFLSFTLLNHSIGLQA